VLVKGGYSKRDQGADNPTFIVETIQRWPNCANGQVAMSLELDAARELSPDVMRTSGGGGGPPRGFGAAGAALWSGSGREPGPLRSRSLKVAASSAALLELRALLGAERVRLERGS
jgi:DNA polymerase III subunit alpha